MTEHLQEEQLILHYYGEAAEANAVDRHLDVCAECRSHYVRLQRVLNSVDAAPVPERDALYGSAVWQRIAPHVKRSRWHALLMPRRWVPALAMAALVVAAFVAVRYSHQVGGPSLSAKDTGPVRERVLMVAVSDHLERSQMILVELANARSEKSVDMTT